MEYDHEPQRKKGRTHKKPQEKERGDMHPPPPTASATVHTEPHPRRVISGQRSKDGQLTAREHKMPGGAPPPDAKPPAAVSQPPVPKKFTSFDEAVYHSFTMKEARRFVHVMGDHAISVRRRTQSLVDSNNFHPKFGEMVRKLSQDFGRSNPVLSGTKKVEGTASRLCRSRQRSPYEPILYTVAHDHKLLQTPHMIMTQAGTLARTPACVYGVGCVARGGVFGFRPPGSPADGFILRADMTPWELSVFERDGTLPREIRPCIMCSRTATLSSYEHNKITGCKNPSVCIQSHYSSTDPETGYDPMYCIFPTNHASYGLVAPLVYFDMSGLSTVRMQLPFDVPGVEGASYYQLEVKYRNNRGRSVIPHPVPSVLHEGSRSSGRKEDGADGVGDGPSDSEREEEASSYPHRETGSRSTAAEGGRADSPRAKSGEEASYTHRSFKPADGQELPLTAEETVHSFYLGAPGKDVSEGRLKT